MSNNNSGNNLGHKLKSIVFFVLTFSLGLSVFYAYFEQNFFERTPAAINKKIHQIKAVNPDKLKEELTNKIQVQNLPNGEKYIRFLSLSSNICKQYARIQLQFVAEGVSVAGEAPTMTVDAECKPAQDPLEMAAILIPVDKILKQKAANATFKFEEGQATFTFANSADEWPRTWIMRSVTFKAIANSDGSVVSGNVVSDKVVSFDKLLTSDVTPTVLEF